MFSENIANLTEAIGRMHDCSVLHSETVTVFEKVREETAFNGKVEISDLEGHPQANKALGWASKDDGGEIQYIGILNIPPIDSPPEAVQTAIASCNFR